MIKYLTEQIRRAWVIWRADRLLPRSGICPHCNKPVINATGWIGKHPYHFECFSAAIKGHQETIECPNCGAIESATVEHGQPFNIYIHHCSSCQYVIMESEWEEVQVC